MSQMITPKSDLGGPRDIEVHGVGVSSVRRQCCNRRFGSGIRLHLVVAGKWSLFGNKADKLLQGKRYAKQPE